MKKLMTIMLAVVMAMGTMVVMTGCGGSDESDMAGVQERGVLVVGITDFEPMDYKDASGNWIGFDADMAAAFADSLGVSVEFVEIDWDNKLPDDIINKAWSIYFPFFTSGLLSFAIGLISYLIIK